MMAHPKRKISTGKRKGKIKITQRARIVERNDATRVARKEYIPMIPRIMPQDNGANFKIKIRRKG